MQHSHSFFGSINSINWLVAVAVTGYLFLLGRRKVPEARPLVVAFAILTAQLTFQLLAPPTGIVILFRGFWVPVISQMLLTAFFLTLAYALLQPLFPRFRQPLFWLLANNLLFLLLISAIIVHDYNAHWQPGTRFIAYWGSFAYEMFQLPLLLLMAGVMAYVFYKVRSRYALLAFASFALWIFSHGLHLLEIVNGFSVSRGLGFTMRGGEMVAIVLLAAAITMPDSARQTFAQRYFSDVQKVLNRLRAEVDRLQAVNAVLAERERLARELHDSVSQALFGIELNISTAETLWQRDPEKALQTLQQARRLGHEALGELRALIANLRPPALQGQNIVEALQAYALSIEKREGIAVQVEGTIQKPLPPAQEVDLYRIAYEAMTNAIKHAAPRLIHVSLRLDAPAFELTVRDDGRGFQPESAGEKGSFGLLGMEERAKRLNADLVISSAPGQGTTVTVTRKDKK